MIRILNYSELGAEAIFARTSPTESVSDTVQKIIARVREAGDTALYEYGEKFDGVRLTSLAVTKEEIEDALTLVEDKFLTVLKKAAINIRRFHEKQVRNSFILNEENAVSPSLTPLSVPRIMTETVSSSRFCAMP